MELKHTVELMKSESYKDRFIAEYWQTKIRYEKLKTFCNNIEASMLSKNVNEPSHDCPLHLLQEQQAAMGKYLKMLEIRAIIENINLEV